MNEQKKLGTVSPAMGRAAALLAAFFAVPAPGAVDLERAPQVGRSVTIVLKPGAEVTRSRIYLGEIAKCQGESQICREAPAIDLGEAPAPGKMVHINVDALERQLRAEWQDATLNIEGPRALRVIAAGVPVDEDALRQSWQEAVNELFPAGGTVQVRVDELQVPGRPMVRPGEYLVSFPALDLLGEKGTEWVMNQLRRTHRLEAVFSAQDTAGGTVVTVMVRMTFLRQLPVASRSLRRGEVLSSEDMVMDWIATDTRKNLIHDMKSLVGRRVRRPVAVGSPIESQAVEALLAGKRGEEVTLMIIRGGMNIKSRARLMKDAGYGQVVEALHLSTRKKIKVRVNGPDQAEIVL